MSFDPSLTDPGTWSPRLREVESRLRSHEDVCEERYNRLRDDHRGLRETINHNSKEFGRRVDDIQHLLIKIALMLLGGMAGILAAIVWLR
jgi:hypothetical protein